MKPKKRQPRRASSPALRALHDRRVLLVAELANFDAVIAVLEADIVDEQPHRITGGRRRELEVPRKTSGRRGT